MALYSIVMRAQVLGIKRGDSPAAGLLRQHGCPYISFIYNTVHTDAPGCTFTDLYHAGVTHTLSGLFLLPIIHATIKHLRFHAETLPGTADGQPYT